MGMLAASSARRRQEQKLPQKETLQRSSIATRRVVQPGPDTAGHQVGLPPRRTETNSWLTEVRRSRLLLAKQRLLAIMFAVRSQRCTRTQSRARRGVGAGELRAGLLKPKTGVSS